jgi:hypothetical protein
MSYNDELREWIAENAVNISYGEFNGIADLSMAQLGALQVLVQAAIHERIGQIHADRDTQEELESLEPRFD